MISPYIYVVAPSEGAETKPELTLVASPGALVPNCGTLSHVAMKR